MSQSLTEDSKRRKKDNSDATMIPEHGVTPASGSGPDAMSSADEFLPQFDGGVERDVSLLGKSYDIIAREGHRYHVNGLAEYQEMYRRSMVDPEGFWGDMARRELRWMSPFYRVFSGGFQAADFSWFLGGKLNACDNCVDRWAEERPDVAAIIFEGDDPKDNRTVTFYELKQNVCRVANVLKRYGVRKGDTVTLYMACVPELAFAMLACARIGAIHNVIFGGFSAASVGERIRDANCQVVVTVDETTRGGKRIPMKSIVDEALRDCPDVRCCFVYSKTGDEAYFVKGRDIWLEEALTRERPYCPPEMMDSEDTLFYLYTSGSTGKPKGVAHTTGGYLLYALATTKYIFDTRQGDIFGCMADLGWITGHTYVVYGPLLNGVTTFMFSSLPNYPDPGRYWRMIEQYRITQFYTAPTAIRLLMRFGDDYPARYDVSSARVLGTVGEPINPEAWLWYYNVVGRARSTIVDTYWQTETGGIVIAPIPGAIRTKAGSATLPFFGIDVGLVDAKTGQEILGNGTSGLLVLRRPWPGLFRTLSGNHQRGLDVYFTKVPGCYLTGDAAYRDDDGYIWINGRVDDTLNVSGHRIGSADIEHALVQVDYVAEAAAVAFPHPIKGQAIFCFVTLKDSCNVTGDQMVQELRQSVRRLVGPFATPDIITATPNMPKTRSGKIMRRILRKLVSNQADELGDISTLADPSVVEGLVGICRDALDKYMASLNACMAKN
ncbi:acetyl-coenzyme A synthetase [Babesia ovata]|uniref:Acetyl-coenzyme A synthetase n=1 Tax=Babesia ovata TaxID=189622 RepID=A0A2H6KEY4_9APIC|nr:acetyl-coenzyme A synthetase [Babesia ovata]GBE61558.1 acetyl-coenzyme A synthetase [Babesia ovata]